MMRTVRVQSCVREAQDVMSLVLEADDGQELPGFEAGAHIDVEIAPQIVRQYSLCPPRHAVRSFRIAIHRSDAGRGGSVRAHASLREGSQLRIGEPRNLFAMDPHAPHSVLFAGGIGVTPLLAMASELQDRGASFALHYSAKSAAHAAFAGELKAAYADRVHLHFSQGAGGEGRLDIDSALANAPPQSLLYVCGPQRFIDAVVACAKARGWDEDAIRRESFAPVREAGEGAEEFVVSAARTGATVPVRKGQSIVQALAAVGIEVPTSCEQGICGTCLTRVLEGVPAHRDAFLTAAERAANDQMLPCCSGSLTPQLVLDL